MNRTILSIVGVFGASSLLLADSAVKGAALLMLAAFAAAILWRDSAATRHLVWLLAIVALLVVPLLSALLPQWRVLPEWARVSPEPVVVNISPSTVTRPVDGAVDLPGQVAPVEVERPSATVDHPAAEPPVLRSALAAPETITEPAVWNWNWTKALPLAWAVGFSVLLLRLTAARLMLWNSERRGTLVWSSRQPAQAAHDHMATTLEAVCLQLGIARPVTLLVHPDKTIPVVWGVLRCRLLLPAAARHWGAEQLRSVMVHELAHIKRHDPTAQLLTQMACALHWFNPLVWFAAWRLGVERELACDNLVLASGVRPSAYAGHLLEVVTECSPVRWTQSCGLAMARKSSLEGRLVAVLSKNLNRRGVSMAIAAIALAIAVGIAVPIAMLRAANEKPAEKPKSAVTDMKPKHEYAQSLFHKWQADARTDGKIPGALIGRLALEIDGFLKQRPQDEKTPKLAALRPRLDASHDWTQADAVALLDDVTAISTAPVSWADLSMEFDNMRDLKEGRPLPTELKTAAWGVPAANGLRAAWLLEPSAEKYPLGSVLKSRVLFHNTGKAPVVFKTETWHQNDPHTARNAKDGEITVSGSWFTGVTPTAMYRLGPGEYCEVMGHGIAIGAGKYEEETSTGSVGAVIEAKEGDDVRLSSRVDASYGGWTRPSDPKDAGGLWKKTIAKRVEREAPMPQAPADREQLIRRVSLDLFGESPSAEETAAFAADNALDALAKLTERLQAKPRIETWAGKLPTGETKFRVTAADQEAAKKPRAANSPGRYVLGDNVHLLVSQTTTEAQRTNKAVIAFLSADPNVASPHKPYEIALPDGIGAYGIVWERGAGELWVMQKDVVRKYDFTNPDQVKETRFEGGIVDVPEHLRGALRKVLKAADAPKEESEKPKEGAKLPPGMEEKLQWGKPANGLRAAIAIQPTPSDAKAGDSPDLYLAVQNVSDAPIHLSDMTEAPKLRELYLKVDGKTQLAIVVKEPTLADATLQPREVTFLLLFPADSKGSDGKRVGSVLAEGALKDTHQTLTAELQIEKAPAGAWTGKLVTGETSGAAAEGKPEPKNKEARALFKMWQDNMRGNGNVPGGLVGRLGDKVTEFIRLNTGDASGDPYAKKMAPLVPRFDASHDWTPAEAAALMDEVAAVTSIPLETATEEIAGRIVTGSPLPPELAKAPWGETQPNGLRLAWLLEPRAAEYRLGAPLKSRILFHNAEKDAVVFRTRTWHQVAHTAHDAKGAEIKVDSTSWTTLGRLTPYRLAPGEFVEVTGAGIGVGAMKNDEDWQGTRVGSWIDAKVGDDVTLTSGPVPANDWNETPPRDGEPGWWLDFITARLSREAPLPADAAERTRILDRAMRDLFGAAPTAEETAAFLADHEPTSLESLAKRLVKRPGVIPYSGSLTSGSTTFRVLPVDPDAAKKPRVANNPGRYTLAENVRLVVTRRPVDERLVNEASIEFFSADPTKPAPGEPYPLKLPDGYDSWAAAWMRGTNVLWLMGNGVVHRYDFTDPAKVRETTYAEPAKAENVPKPILDALHAAAPGAPKPATQRPK